MFVFHSVVFSMNLFLNCNSFKKSTSFVVVTISVITLMYHPVKFMCLQFHSDYSIQGKVQASINEYSPAVFGGTQARIYKQTKRDASFTPGPGSLAFDPKPLPEP
jgi:hypothetical protein